MISIPQTGIQHHQYCHPNKEQRIHQGIEHYHQHNQHIPLASLNFTCQRKQRQRGKYSCQAKEYQKHCHDNEWVDHCEDYAEDWLHDQFGDKQYILYFLIYTYIWPSMASWSILPWAPFWSPYFSSTHSRTGMDHGRTCYRIGSRICSHMCSLCSRSLDSFISRPHNLGISYSSGSRSSAYRFIPYTRPCDAICNICCSVT